MTLHPRRDWTSVPAANSNPVVRSLLDGVAIHWNGPKVPLSALTDPRSYLEGVRRYHVSTNGWSDIAYNLAVDQTGDEWVLRGWDHQSGANGDERVNDRYLAILCIIGEGQKPSAAMLAGVRSAVARFRKKYPTAPKIVTHRAIRPAGTECPGSDLTRETNAGTFEPVEEESDVQLDENVPIGAGFAEEFGFPADKTYTVGQLLAGGWGHAREAARDAAVARALAEASALAGRPLTADEIEAAVVKAIAEHVVKVDVTVNGQ